MVDVLVAGEDIISSRPKDLAVIIEAWYKAQDYIKNNPEESFSIMAGPEQMKPKDFGYFYESFTFFTLEQNMEVFGSDSFAEKLTEMSEFLYSHNAVSNNADADKLYTDKIIKYIK